MLLGIAMCSATLFALSCLRIAWSPGWTIVFLLVIAIALAIVATHDVGWSVTRDSLHWVDLLTLGTLAGYTLFATVAHSAENDSIAIWGLKGAVFFVHRGIDWAFLQNPWYVWDHPDYPLLLPLSLDFLALFRGAWEGALAGLLHPFFAAAIVTMVRSMLGDEFPPLPASIATFAIAPLAMSPWIGMAEGPLIAFGTAGVLLARRWNLFAASLLLGCAAMTKNEGLALIVAVAIGLLLARRGRDVVRLWPAVVIALPWLIARVIFSLPTDIATGPLLERLVERLRSPGVIVAALAANVPGMRLLCFGIVAALLLTARFARDEAFALGAMAAQIAFYVAVYVVTPRDLGWHIRSSWPRLVTHVALTLAFVAVVLLFRWISSSEPSVARSA
jgi:hypothetical protein